jgi:Peptidase family M28
MDLESLEDRLLAEVSGTALLDATRKISEGVRLSGSPDEWAALQWLEEQLVAAGFQTRLIRHPAYISLPGAASLHVQGEARGFPCITHSFGTTTPAEGITALLAYLPEVGAAPTAGLRGCIALIPGMASADTIRLVQEHGSLAQVFIHDEHLHETAVSPVWGSPSDETIGLLPATPSISIRRADADRLLKQLRSGPCQVTLRAVVESGWREIPLLTADLHAPAGEAAPFVLFSGHIDSWHHGAMDNGSANATMLEVARLLAPHRRSLRRGLRIAFWSGHSHGRYAGSAWYADHQWHELTERCVAHVNVDSLGGRDAVVVTEPPVMPQTRGLAAAVLRKITGEQLVGKRLVRFADQSFYGHGINCLYGTLSEQDSTRTEGQLRIRLGNGRAGGLGWWWHTPEDTLDKLDAELLVRDARIYLASILRLLCEPLLPFDYREAVQEIREAVDSLSTAAGSAFDFAALRGELAGLDEAVHRVHRRLERPPKLDPSLEQAANDWSLAISRPLVRVAFHENGPFRTDLMAAMQPVPSLQPARDLAKWTNDSDAAHLLRTRLQRRYNWVLEEIRGARAVTVRAEAVLD